MLVFYIFVAAAFFQQLASSSFKTGKPDFITALAASIVWPVAIVVFSGYYYCPNLWPECVRGMPRQRRTRRPGPPIRTQLPYYISDDPVISESIPIHTQTQYEVHFLHENADEQIYEDIMCCICHEQLCHNNMTTQNAASKQPRGTDARVIDCVCDVVQPDDSCLLACGHVLHAACFMEWLRVKQQCPQCKSTQLLSNCKLLRTRNDVAAVHT